MNESKYYALVIVAHPDDESFLFAGTCLKFAEEGKAVMVVCATKGEKGTDRLNRNLSEEVMAQIRTKELKQACQTLHCDCADYFKYPDGALDKTDYAKLISELKETIERYQPEIILTFGPEGISGHRDHIIIGKAATDSALVAKHKVKEIWLSSMPTSSIDEFNKHLAARKVHHTHYHERELLGVPDEKLLKINIEKYSQQKHDAIKTHQSQYLPQFYQEVFQKYECFEVIKLS